MKLIIGIIFFLFIMIPENLQAQGDFAVLEKNVNVRASGLSQELNATKDTLILKSDSYIKQVYAVNMDYKREVDINVRDTSVRIPLKPLSKGKHVFVAVQSSLRLVFVVKILGDDRTLASLGNTATSKN